MGGWGRFGVGIERKVYSLASGEDLKSMVNQLDYDGIDPLGLGLEV